LGHSDDTGASHPDASQAESGRSERLKGPRNTYGLPGLEGELASSFALLANGVVTLLPADGAIAARIEDGVFSVEAAAGALAPMLGFHAPLAGSLAADALATGSPVALDAAENDPRVAAHFLAPFAPRHILVAPVMVAGEARGFLLALNSRPGSGAAFSPAAAMLLERLADFGAIALRHNEVALRAERGATQARTLADMVQQINQSLELERVVSLMASHAAHLLGARGARVAILDEGRLITAGVYGDATDPVGSSADLWMAFGGQAVRERRPVRTADLRTFSDQWVRTGHDAALGEGRANGASAPLLIGGRAIGAVTVFGNETRDFTEHDEALLLSLANHAAIAIENARLYRAAAYTARHASLLATTARSLAFHPNPRSVYETLTGLVRDLLGAAGFSIVLADPDTRHVELGYTTGAAAGLVRFGWENFWESIGAQVVLTGTPVFAPVAENALAHTDEAAAAEIQASEVRSLAMLPLMGEGKPRGLLTLRYLTRRKFDDAERRLLEDFATQVAVALRNAQLTEADRGARERERVLSEAVHQSEKLAAIGELVAGVAHELNNPLAGISTFAQLLLEDRLTEAQVESVRTIKLEADRAASVIRDLLTFARKTGPRHVLVDLNAVVQQTVRLRGYALQSAGIEVEFDLDPALPSTTGDDQKLQQVLLNLLVNAEYAMRGSEIRRLMLRSALGTAEQGNRDRLVVEVADTGVGMTPDVCKHIFEPFFTTKPVGVGTGLGLSVSYGIVSAHGGTLDVRSEPGKGATFTLTLPVARATAPPSSV
jgi:signal transduction histidine kinase